MKLVWLGFLLGVLFGVAAQAGRFCLHRGLRQLYDHQEPLALRSFVLALAVAAISTQVLIGAGMMDISQAAIVKTEFSAGGMLIGGALFGFGMSLARCCGARALILTSSGNCRALVTLVALGLSAQATLTGVFLPFRQLLQQIGRTTVNTPSIPEYMLTVGFSSEQALYLIVSLLVLLVLLFCLRSFQRESFSELLMSSVIGLLVAAGWWITSNIEFDEFNPIPPSSLSFIGPVAETILYSQVAVGRTFGIAPAIVLGTVVGGFAISLGTRTFVLQIFETPTQFVRYVLGGLLMGFGGVLAMGCSIGQGLSGLSTLAWASIPACGGILIGTYFGFITETFLNRKNYEPS